MVASNPRRPDPTTRGVVPKAIALTITPSAQLPARPEDVKQKSYKGRMSSGEQCLGEKDWQPLWSIHPLV